jgi:hypothetical protein
VPRGNALSQQIFRIVLHPVLLQQAPEFIDERGFAMVLLLIRDVAAQNRDVRPAYRESRARQVELMNGRRSLVLNTTW